MTIRTDSFALTPKRYSPVAQYALRGRGAELYPDRSGNGLHLSQSFSPACGPDGYPDTCLHAGKVASAALVPLQILGDLTVTVRACALYNGARQFLYNENDGTAVASPYCLLVEPDGTIKVACESSTQNDYVYATTLLAKWGRWAVYSIRRDVAGGRWTVGLNKTYQTSGPMTVTVPLNGTQPKLYAGGPDVGPQLWAGFSADLSIWDQRLTDAQVSGIVDAMGIVP
jgi:hypothetical protein